MQMVPLTTMHWMWRQRTNCGTSPMGRGLSVSATLCDNLWETPVTNLDGWSRSLSRTAIMYGLAMSGRMYWTKWRNIYRMPWWYVWLNIYCIYDSCVCICFVKYTFFWLIWIFYFMQTHFYVLLEYDIVVIKQDAFKDMCKKHAY